MGYSRPTWLQPSPSANSPPLSTSRLPGLAFRREPHGQRQHPQPSVRSMQQCGVRAARGPSREGPEARYHWGRGQHPTTSDRHPSLIPSTSQQPCAPPGQPATGVSQGCLHASLDGDYAMELCPEEPEPGLWLQSNRVTVSLPAPLGSGGSQECVGPSASSLKRLLCLLPCWAGGAPGRAGGVLALQARRGEAKNQPCL